MTEGKRTLILHQMPAIDQWVFEHVGERQRPCGDWDLLKPVLLVKPLKEAGILANPKEVRNAFARLGYLNLGERKFDGSGNSFVLWAVRNKEAYQTMSLDQLRRVWCSQLATAERDAKTSQAIFDEDLAIKAARDQTPY